MAEIVAFCGIDGAGKTTTLDRLREDDRFRLARFVKKQQKEEFQRVLRLAPPSEPLPDAYFGGLFAQAARWAHALDFLRFYETVVRPHEGDDGLILSDRWSFCTVTFADFGTNLRAEIEFLLQAVPRPALTFYLDVEPEVAVERIERRGPLGHDEHVELLAAYKRAYDRYFGEYDGALVRLSGLTTDEVHERVIAALEARALIPAVATR